MFHPRLSTARSSAPRCRPATTVSLTANRPASPSPTLPGATWLRTFDDNAVMIPNAEFLKGAVANSNSGALDEMVVIPVDLPLPCNVAEARAIAADAARASPYCYLKKPVAVAVS